MPYTTTNSTGGKAKQHDARQAAFAGEGLHLAPDLEPLADR